jgi:hypothetical protein
MKKDFIENIHYYLSEGRVVFTERYHLERGYCCGNGCKHCPFDPRHEKDNKKVAEVKTNT